MPWPCFGALFGSHASCQVLASGAGCGAGLTTFISRLASRQAAQGRVLVETAKDPESTAEEIKEDTELLLQIHIGQNGVYPALQCKREKVNNLVNLGIRTLCTLNALHQVHVALHSQNTTESISRYSEVRRRFKLSRKFIHTKKQLDAFFEVANVDQLRTVQLFNHHLAPMNQEFKEEWDRRERKQMQSFRAVMMVLSDQKHYIFKFWKEQVGCNIDDGKIQSCARMDSASGFASEDDSRSTGSRTPTTFAASSTVSLQSSPSMASSQSVNGFQRLPTFGCGCPDHFVMQDQMTCETSSSIPASDVAEEHGSPSGFATPEQLWCPQPRLQRCRGFSKLPLLEAQMFGGCVHELGIFKSHFPDAESESPEQVISSMASGLSTPIVGVVSMASTSGTCTSHEAQVDRLTQMQMALVGAI